MQKNFCHKERKIIACNYNLLSRTELSSSSVCLHLMKKICSEEKNGKICSTENAASILSEELFFAKLAVNFYNFDYKIHFMEESKYLPISILT